MRLDRGAEASGHKPVGWCDIASGSHRKAVLASKLAAQVATESI